MSVLSASGKVLLVRPKLVAAYMNMRFGQVGPRTEAW